MSYPEATYLGDRGEVSATYRPANQAPELTYPNGNTGHYLATGASTGGLFGLYRWVMRPEPSGPGPTLPSVDRGIVLRADGVRGDLRRVTLDRH
jgi:hypothetical protein